MPATLRPLLAALQGKPSETEATKVIAVYSAIPAAIGGIFVGAAFVPTAADSGVLFLSAGGGAIAAATATVLVIHAAYRIFGFRTVVCVGSAVTGAILGFCLLSLFVDRMSGPAKPWLLPFGTIVGAVVGGALGWSSRASS